MSERPAETASLLLERLRPFTTNDVFGGIVLSDGQVSLYIVGGEAAARSAGLELGPANSVGRLTIHDCPYSRRELAFEGERLSSVLAVNAEPELAGVVSLGPKPDGTELQITCMPGTSIDALRPLTNYPFDVAWRSPPTTSPTS